jgi:hypothetical protein
MPIAQLGLRVDPTGAASGLKTVEQHLDRTANAARRVESELKRAEQVGTQMGEVMRTASEGSSRAQQSWDRLASSVSRSAGTMAGSISSVGVAAQKTLSQMADEAFVRIGSDIKMASADFKAGKISLDDYRVAMETARTEAISYRETMAGLSTQQAGKFNAIMTQTATILPNVGRGISSLRGPMTMIAASSLDMSRGWSRLITNFMMLGVGGEVVLAVVAGAAAIGYAWDFLTKDARKHAEEVRKFNEELDKSVKDRRDRTDPNAKFQENIAKVVADQNRLLEKRRNLERDISSFSSVEPGALGRLEMMRDGLKEINDELAKIGPRAVELGAQLAEGLAQTDTGQKAREIADTIAALQLQATTISMTDREAALYELRLHGATEAQLALADSALRVVENFKRQQDAQRESARLAKEHARELERLAQEHAREVERIRKEQEQKEDQETQHRLDRLKGFLNRMQELDIQIATMGFENPEDVERFRLAYDNLTDAERRALDAKLEELKMARLAHDALEKEKNKAKELQDQWDSAWKAEQGAIADFLTQLGSAEMSLAETAKRMVMIWVQMLAQMAAANAASDMKNFFGSLLKIGVQAAGSAFVSNGVYVPAAPDIPAVPGIPVMHGGGRVGGPATSRHASMSMFAGARRYHEGGTVLKNDEVPIIARRGETVMTPEQMAASNQPVTVNQVLNFNFSALDARGMAELLQQQKGTIAQIVVDAAAQSAAFSKAITSPGRRG